MVRIQEFMQRKGIKKQDELAEMLGISQKAVSAWNTGRTAPTHETCVKLLKMGMTFKELFGEEFPDITFEQFKELSGIHAAERNSGMHATERKDVSEKTPEQELDEKVEDSVLRLFENLFTKK